MKGAEGTLKGTTREVYYYLLRANRSVGIREIQRTLELSSSSVARYHLGKLESAGFVKHEHGAYFVSKVVLENAVKVNNFLVPRHFFYTLFVTTALVIELSFLRPPSVTSVYFFAVMITAACLVIFLYETVRVWVNQRP